MNLLEEVLNPVNRADPFPWYERIRDEGPIALGVVPGIVTAGYADCADVLRDPHMSSDRRKTSLPDDVVSQMTGVAGILGRTSLNYLDGADHLRLRRLVTGAFLPQRVEALRPRVVGLVDAALDAAALSGELEAIERLAYAIPLRVIGELLGIPDADLPWLHSSASATTQILDPFFAVTGASGYDASELAVLAADLHAYFGALAAERRRSPRDDLASALVHAAYGIVGDDDVAVTLMLLLIAGHETTVNLIGNGLLALIDRPDLRRCVSDDPRHAPTVVDEMLRWDPPVHMTVRNALAATEIGGARVQAGDLVVLVLAGANRDPAVFEAPAELRVDRPSGRHLTFGAGPHFCAGAALARMEASIVFTRFCERVVGPRRLTDQLTYKPHVVFRGLSRLDVGFDEITRMSAVAGLGS